DQQLVDSILYERPPVLGAEEALLVGLVLRKQQGDVSIDVEPPVAERVVRGGDDSRSALAGYLAKGRLRRGGPPAPSVAEPKGWEGGGPGEFGAPVCGADADAEVLGRCLGVLEENVEVSVVGEDARVEQLVFELRARAALVGRHQFVIGVGPLRILVEVLHVRMGRGAIEVEVVFLHVLAVISLAVGEAEEALLENGIFLVPQSQREAELLLVVRDPGQTILAPVVRAGPRLLVREVVPGIAVLAVVLADGAPLTFAEIGPPLPPRNLLLASLLQSLRLTGRV